jgi:hypothetical protein
VSAVTGPILGVVIGGWIFSKLGGYTSPKSLPLATLGILLAAAGGFPSVFANTLFGCMGLLWVQFFFGGFVLPVMTGILLNTMPPSLRTMANSIANLMYNLLGYLPAPFVYGFAY